MRLAEIRKCGECHFCRTFKPSGSHGTCGHSSIPISSVIQNISSSSPPKWCPLPEKQLKKGGVDKLKYEVLEAKYTTERERRIEAEDDAMASDALLVAAWLLRQDNAADIKWADWVLVVKQRMEARKRYKAKYENDNEDAKIGSGKRVLTDDEVGGLLKPPDLDAGPYEGNGTVAEQAEGHSS